jgi:hypothetical protein
MAQRNETITQKKKTYTRPTTCVHNRSDHSMIIEKNNLKYKYFTLLVKGEVVPVLNELSTTPRRHMGESMCRSTFS